MAIERCKYAKEAIATHLRDVLTANGEVVGSVHCEKGSCGASFGKAKKNPIVRASQESMGAPSGVGVYGSPLCHSVETEMRFIEDVLARNKKALRKKRIPEMQPRNRQRLEKELAGLTEEARDMDILE